MRVVYMGTPDFAVGTLEAIVAAGHTVTGVITQPDKPVGRSGKLQPTAVKKAALAHDLPVFQPKRVRDPEFMHVIEECAPDVIVVAAFGQIIPKTILDYPKYGCLNVHASLLPKYRGAAPIQWAVIDGEEKSGVTIMQMNEGLDTGDMLTVREVPLAADETGGSLFDRLSEVGAELLVELLADIEKNGADALHPVKQPEESPTPYARMMTKADGLVDWTKSAEEIERLIRGLNPWPCAYSGLNGKSLKIWKAEVVDANVSAPDDSAGLENSVGVPNQTDDGEGFSTLTPGAVVNSGKEGLLVQCGKGQLLITELQLEGKKRMQAADFLRGHAIEVGTELSA